MDPALAAAMSTPPAIVRPAAQLQISVLSYTNAPSANGFFFASPDAAIAEQRDLLKQAEVFKKHLEKVSPAVPILQTVNAAFSLFASPLEKERLAVKKELLDLVPLAITELNKTLSARETRLDRLSADLKANPKEGTTVALELEIENQEMARLLSIATSKSELHKLQAASPSDIVSLLASAAKFAPESSARAIVILKGAVEKTPALIPAGSTYDPDVLMKELTIRDATLAGRVRALIKGDSPPSAQEVSDASNPLAGVSKN